MTFGQMYLTALRWTAAIGLAICTILAACICVIVIISAINEKFSV